MYFRSEAIGCTLRIYRIYCRPVQIKAFVIKRPRSLEKRKLPPRMNDRLTFGSLLKEAIPLTYEDGDGEDSSPRPDKSVVFTLRRHPFQSTISFRSPNGRDLRLHPPPFAKIGLCALDGGGEGEFEYGSEEEAKEESPDKSECYDERGRVGIIQGVGIPLPLPSILSAYGIRGEREREEREMGSFPAH